MDDKALNIHYWVSSSLINMSEVKVPNPEFTKEVIRRGGETLNLCFQCGTCTASCPSGRNTAFRTRQLVRKAQLGLKEDIMGNTDLWMCTTCYTCMERCPRGVEIVDIITALRNIAFEEGHVLPDHKKVAMTLIKSGHTVPLTEDYAKMRREMGLPEKPPTVLSNEQALRDLETIIRKVGFDKLIGGD